MKMKAWIARDKDCELFLYEKKPQKVSKTQWYALTSDVQWGTIKLNGSLFPEVEWEDEEPTEVEVEIKKRI